MLEKNGWKSSTLSVLVDPSGPVEGWRGTRWRRGLFIYEGEVPWKFRRYLLVALGVERWFDGESDPLHSRFRHHSDHA